MKFTRLLSLLLFIFLMTSCSKSETPTPKPDAEEQPKSNPKPDEPQEPEDEVYFSYYVDPNDPNPAGWTDQWIVIHNQDGELLDYRSFKKGDSLDFEVNSEKFKNITTLSVTRLNYKPGNDGGNFHSIATQTGIRKGTIWDWTNVYEPSLQNPTPTNNHRIFFKVNNVPNVKRFDLTSQFHGFVAGHPFYQETDVLEFNALMHYDIDYLLALRDGNDQIRYKFQKLVNPVSNITLDYSDFLEYDQVLEIHLPEHRSYSARVYARNKAENYASSLNISNDHDARQIQSIAKLGYINDFDTFETHISIHYTEYSRFNFYKTGLIPTGINVPVDFQFVVDNNNMYAFHFSTDVNYWRNSSNWLYDDRALDNKTRYTISGKTENNITIGLLPDEILNKYPFLNLENLQYQSTTLRINEFSEDTDNHTTLFGTLIREDVHSESLTFEKTE